MRNGGGMATVTAPERRFGDLRGSTDEELRRWSPGQRRALARRLAALDRPKQPGSAASDAAGRRGPLAERATRYGRVAVVGVTATGLTVWRRSPFAPAISLGTAV